MLGHGMGLGLEQAPKGGKMQIMVAQAGSGAGKSALTIASCKGKVKCGLLPTSGRISVPCGRAWQEQASTSQKVLGMFDTSDPAGDTSVLRHSCLEMSEMQLWALCAHVL